MYLRFESLSGEGLFARAHHLRDAARFGSVRMSRAHEREFNELLAWLSLHTPGPPASAYRDSRSRAPRTGWKACAEAHVGFAWRMSVLMGRYRHNVRPLYSASPGRILFEDRVQVVIRPNRANTQPTPARGTRQGWSGDRTTIRRMRAFAIDWLDGRQCAPPRYEHPAANLFRKHEKSATFRIGGVVEPSQLG